MSHCRRNPTPEHLTCRACAHDFHWNGLSMRRPHYCKREACRRARQNDAAYRYFAANSSKGTVLVPKRTWVNWEPLRVRMEPREPEAYVDRLLLAAARRRKAEERAAGCRRYTILDGWCQRPGRSTIDGELTTDEVSA